MRNVLLLSALMLGFASQVFAANVEYKLDDNAPSNFRHVQPFVVIRQGTKPLSVRLGLNPLDKPRILNCHSSMGCVVTAKIWVATDGLVNGSVSAYVDGAPMRPNIRIQGGWPIFTAQQSTILASGEHTIQSEVHANVQEGHVLSWEAEYEKYDLR